MLIHYQYTSGVHCDTLYICVRVSDSGGWVYPMGFRAALGTPLARKSPWQCERYAHMRAHVCGCFVLLPTQQKSAVQESRNTSISTIIKCCCKYDFISLAEHKRRWSNVVLDPIYFHCMEKNSWDVLEFMTDFFFLRERERVSQTVFYFLKC